jgi:hypothetical protein
MSRFLSLDWIQNNAVLFSENFLLLIKGQLVPLLNTTAVYFLNKQTMALITGIWKSLQEGSESSARHNL